MDADTLNRYTARAKVVKALAHPTRLFVVNELSQHGRRCVCELTELIGADISTVSRHLAVLKNAGVVRDQRCGSQVFYELAVDCVLNFLNCIDAVMQQRACDEQNVWRS